MAINHKDPEIYFDALTIARQNLVENKSLAQAKNTFYQVIKNNKVLTEKTKHSRIEGILNYFEIHGALDLQRTLEHIMKAEHCRGNTTKAKGIQPVTVKEAASIIKVENSVSCIICRKKCNTILSFKKHYKKKHLSSAIRNLEINEEHRLANVASIEAGLKKYRNKEEIKAALRKQLAPSLLDDLPVYNAEAYRIAIRTMPQGDAYKLAKDVERSKAFIEDFNKSLVNSAKMLVPPNNLGISNVQKIPSKIIDHYRPTQIGEKLIVQAKEERAQREALANLFSQEDVEEKAIFSERMVKSRTNQAEFAKRVASNFSYKCCITGSTEPIEAAHIEPLSLGDNNNTSNGLLLIVCLHRLLDSGKMAINPDSLTVHFSRDCTWFGVPIFNGKAMASPHTPLNMVGLKKLWDRFAMKHL